MRFSLPNPISPSHFHRGLRTIIVMAIFLGITFGVSITAYAEITGPGREACPNEEPIIVPGVEKKLIQMGPSRPGDCVTPQVIVMHNTDGGTLDSNWTLFNENQRGGGQNAGFIIGTDGHTYQTVEFYQEMAEITYTSNYINRYAISIEMVGPYTHANKEAQPIEQYNAALALVCFLMGQYNIPLGTTEADWISTTESNNEPEWVPGIYGHYQVVPSQKEDPGQGWLADFRDDLRAGNCSSSHSSGGGGGRMVPYDAYARPYSWPISGKIKQDYGFTEQAQNLGARYPGFYPIGDPGAIFSTTNHDEPPIDPATAKYINPNIDIEPVDNSTQARAVYATHAGWLTYAEWAGPEKGYTIQIESDVEGDGQSDLATRYMRLQPPVDGYFAPNIPVTLPPVSGVSSAINGACAVPSDEEWANVNRWDEQVKAGIKEIYTRTNIEVPCNLVKAFMKLESNGEELPPNADGYMGLMQVATDTATGGGSNCDWRTYDVTTTQGNINCGVHEIANGYEACNNSWDGAILKYFSGQCESTGATDAFGTSTDQYLQIVKENWEYLDSQAGSAPAPITSLPQPNPTEQNPQTTEQITPPPYVLEAEYMKPAIEAGGAEVAHDDAAASGGASMKLTTNVFINETVWKKADQLMIRAKSSRNAACLNQDDAEMEVYIDNELVDTITITSTIFQTFPLAVEGLDGRDHNLSLRLANPGALLCNRTLWIDSIHYVITNPNTPTVETVSSVTIEAEDLEDVTETDKPSTIVEDTSASEDHYVAFTSNSTREGEVIIPESNYFTIRARADLCGEGHGVPFIKVSLDDEELIDLGVDNEYWTEYSYKLGAGQEVGGTNNGTPPSTSTPPGTSDPSTGDGDDTGSGDDGGPTRDDLYPIDPRDPGGPLSTPTPPGNPLVLGETTESGDVLQATDDEEAEEEDAEPTPQKLTIEFYNDEFIAGVCDRNVYVDVITFKKFEVTQATYSKTSMIGQTTYVAYNQLIGYVSSSRGTDTEWEAYSATLPEVNMDDPELVDRPELALELENKAKEAFAARVPNAQQTYLSYRIMFNNPNFTTFPPPNEADKFINAKVDNPYVVETDDNKIAGRLKTVFDEPESPMFFFCAPRRQGDEVKCITEPNP